MKNCSVAAACGWKMFTRGIVTCITGAPAENVKRPMPLTTMRVVDTVTVGLSTTNEPKYDLVLPLVW